MKSIAAYAYSTGATGLKCLSGMVERGFGLFGLHRSPSGVRVSDAALSRRETQVARLYEQGASKLRIARYLIRWLGWAVAVANISCLAYAEEIVNISLDGVQKGCKISSGGTFTYYDSNGSPNSQIDLSGLGMLWVRLYEQWLAYTDAGGAGNLPCDVVIRAKSVAINVNTSAGGTAACSPATVEYGLSTTCTATPEPGYSFSAWGDACAAVGASSTCQLTFIGSAKTVSATFTAIPGYVPTGPVVQIVVDPTSPTTLYSALDGGGVYKKVGAGNWTAASTQPTNLKVKALAITSAGTTLYAGTDGAGVFKSSDSGVTWAACANTNLTNLNLRSLALSGTTLYAGTTAGVFVSSDDCASWTALNTGMP